GYVQPWKSPRPKMLQNLFFRHGPIPVLSHQSCIRNGCLADPVGQQEIGCIGATNRIGDDSLVKMTGDYHGMAPQKGGSLYGSSPQNLSSKLGLTFRRMNMAPHRGMNAVCAN